METTQLAELKSQAVDLSRQLYAKSQAPLLNELESTIPDFSPDDIKTKDSFGQRIKYTPISLISRSRKTLGNFVGLVEDSLERSYAEAGNQRIITDVQITLEAEKNQVFGQGLLEQFDKIESNCRACGLRYKLGKPADQGGANIEIAVAGPTGNIVRYFKRGERVERAIGTLSAIPAAVLLASLGNLPNARFCNQTYRKLPSSVGEFPEGLINCETLDEPGHSLDFEEAVQVRASLPLFYALRKQASAETLRRLYKDFSFTDLRSKSGNASHGEQLAYEMSYGVVQSSPMHQLEVINQLGDVLYGRSESLSTKAISQFLVSDLKEGRRYLEFNKTNPSVNITGNYLRTQNAKATLRQLMRADTESSKGALKSFNKLRYAKFLLTKTSRSYTKEQQLRDHWLVASVLIRGQRYSVSAFVGSEKSDQQGLAKQLSADQLFGPIMAEIVDSLD